ncbi:hypothetical protein ACTXG7_24720 [Mycolicibacterium sp. Dal123E01]|uniref:hypothetical protein n=1 Tax=Mycolicibacterium sp. Dal123E01 TaxID=3457578 RepID=UPI00403E82CE
MALIREFHNVVSDRQDVHKPVSCGWRTFHAGGDTILQLDTYGSDQRKIANKVSQTIQLDRDGAVFLLNLIREAFPGL